MDAKCHRAPLLEFLYYYNDITAFPKPGLNASGHGWAHAVRAADFHEVVVHRVNYECVDMIVEFLGESLYEPRISFAVLTNDAVRRTLDIPWFRHQSGR
ncbi:MAG: hypothetical protein KGO02_07930 [Alphaproteobacteria bacterium]|nr:hypothetical protein [Alphaproteobacteria bacterium]